MLRSTFTRWSLLALLTLWLAVIAPGHERGVIKVDDLGPGASAEGQTSCCAQPAQDDNENSGPCEDPAVRCALCYLNGVLDLPVALDLTPTYLGLLGRIDLLRLTDCYAAPIRLPYHGRAPPITA